MKVGLGTAQFGMDYGITNAAGRVLPANAGHILRRAADSGVDLIDTAAAYGESEAVLGDLLWSGHPFRLVSKVPPLTQRDGYFNDAATRVRASVTASLRRLRQDRLYGMLFHRVADLLNADGRAVLAALIDVKSEGLIEKIGVSVYAAEEIDAVLELLTPDIVQIPLNALDQRLLHSGHVDKLADASIEIHARSVFLQGVLLTDPARLPGYFSPYAPLLQRFRQSALASGLGPLGTALGFITSIPKVHAAIVGVTTAEELDEIMRASRASGPFEMDWPSYRCDEEMLINPALWPPCQLQGGTRISA